MSLLVLAGNDKDCNASLIGNVWALLGVVPEKWAVPIGDLLETCLKCKEQLSIHELAEKTAGFVHFFRG